MMRWQDYTATRPPEEVELLLNELTVGWGYLRQAVRVLSQDGELARVVEVLSRAHDFLSRSAALLAQERGSASDGPMARPDAVSLSPVTAAVSWQDLLATRTLFDRARLLALLEEAVRESRQAGQALLADGAVATIHDHVTRSLLTLDATLHELHTPSSDAATDR